jgi:hypothetical protein
MHPDPNDKIMASRGSFLTWGWWGFRAIIYFVLFFVMVYLLNGWSKKQDESGSRENGFPWLDKMSRFSGPTMVFFILTVTFASIDWVMTLDPHWFSTIFGLLFVIGWGLSALAFTIALLAWLSDREPLRHLLGKKHFHDLGKLMLAMVMVWAYFNFSQYLIIYSGNLPEETHWYITRQKGAWAIVGGILIFFHFAFPFLMLLSRDIKRNTRYLPLLAIFILVMRIVDMYYIIGPSPTLHGHGGEFHPHLLDLGALIAIGGIWLWSFFGELIKRPLIPINDPYLDNAIAHGKGH